jgi:hypothetical protein
MNNNIELNDTNFFYSTDWRQEVFAFGSLPFFDVMIDNEYLYLIKMPEAKLNNVKEYFISFASLFTGSGLIGFYAIGDTRKIKYYKTYRLSWVDSDNKLTSQDYEKHVFLKVPLSDLKDKITFGKNKFYLTYNGKKVTLIRKTASLKLQKGADVEFARLSQFLGKHFSITSARNKFSIS